MSASNAILLRQGFLRFFRIPPIRSCASRVRVWNDVCVELASLLSPQLQLRLESSNSCPGIYNDCSSI